MCRIKAPEWGRAALTTGLLMAGIASFGQLVINEVCASNSSLLQDEDGDFGDWIEIHNPGGDTLNLEGYSLSDELAVPAKWTFPAYRIPPGGYLAVFASGKDRKASPLWWHSPVREGDDWKYILPGAGTAASWESRWWEGRGPPTGLTPRPWPSTRE